MNSIVSYPERGEGGSNAYRGNCSPKLIEDIIDQYQLRSLSDYMMGSGTAADVCRAKNIPGRFLDLRYGFDMLSMDIPDRPENIFWHPPYHDIVVYSDGMYSAQEIVRKYGFDPRTHDLSRCRTWEDFTEKMNFCCLKQFTALEKGGRMFLLLGDIKRQRCLYSMLLNVAKPGTVEQVIIKAQHHCMSDSRRYSGNFVRIVHEYLLVLRKDSALIFDIQLPHNAKGDVRDMGMSHGAILWPLFWKRPTAQWPCLKFMNVSTATADVQVIRTGGIRFARYYMNHRCSRQFHVVFINTQVKGA